VPLWVILRAAKVYEVSVDFIFGVTDDWETGSRMTQEREVSAWLGDMLMRMRDGTAGSTTHPRFDTLKRLP
jgi:hypothetical protein